MFSQVSNSARDFPLYDKNQHPVKTPKPLESLCHKQILKPITGKHALIIGKN
jgi:hypothetical protein